MGALIAANNYLGHASAMGKKSHKKAAGLTDEQKRAATRLRAEWDRKRDVMDLRQDTFGKNYRLGSQGNVGQYLNGHIALNYPALVKFCRGLHVDPEEIYPELVHRVHGEQELDRRSDLPPDAEEIAHLYRQLSPKARDHIKAFLRMAVTLTRNGMDVNLEPDERYLEYEKDRENDPVERRKERT